MPERKTGLAVATKRSSFSFALNAYPAIIEDATEFGEAEDWARKAKKESEIDWPIIVTGLRLTKWKA